MFYNSLISWDVFNTKFSGKQQYAFEQLSYLLFCDQYDQPMGIFKYFNQAGLETLPIPNDSDIIGFQSKFYGDSISMSSKETELKKCITTTKTKYPNIIILQFFISKEFSESRKKDKVKPQCQLNLEKYADSLGMEIIWCMRSYFEKTLASSDLLHIKDIFFNTNEGISNYIDQITASSEIIFQQLKSELKFKESVKRISRDFSCIDSFVNSSKNYLIISGNGGSGKSALIKDWYLNHKDEFPCFVFRATDFQVASLAEFSRKFGDYTFNDFLSSFKNDEQKIIIIDSAEKLFLLDNQDAFKDALRILLNAKWKIIFTIRTSYSNLLVNAFLFTGAVKEYNVKDLSVDELKEVLTELELVIPTNELLIDLLCNLFYLYIYLQCAEQQNPVNETIASFKKRIWDFVIKDITNANKNLDVRRENTIIKIVSQYISNGLFYTPSDRNDDPEAIGALRSNGIIVYDSNSGYILSHDIYEEWVLEHIIESVLNQTPTPLGFFNNIGNSLVMRKAFRKWLSEQTKASNQRINGFIIQALTETNFGQIWLDEILISIMNGELEDILHTQLSLFDRNNYSLLMKMAALLNTTCQSINMDFIGKVFTPQEIREHNIYKYTKPSGKAWYTVFEYINNEKAKIQWNEENIDTVIRSLSNWVRNNGTGLTTKVSGEIALYIYDIIKFSKELKYSFRDEKLKNIVSVILDSAQEIKNDLEMIFQEVIDKKENKYNTKYDEICNQLLYSGLDCSACCMVMPDYMIQLAWLFWLRDEKPNDIFNYAIDEVEKAFGVDKDHDYYPTSAHKTFIFQLLRNHPNKAVDFIIDFFNHVTECYNNSEFSDECFNMTLSLPNDEKIQQICSQRLWLMHRGTTVAPNLLECILMALERWLLFAVNESDEDISKEICLDLIVKSKTAALTSVVVSAVIAYPENLFDIACILLQTGEIFQLDIKRVTAEHGANFFRGGLPRNEFFDKERINTNNQEFRKKHLEDIFINYQIQDNVPDEVFKKRIDRLRNIFDTAFEQVDKDDTSRQMSLYRMDLRKYIAQEEIIENGSRYIALSTNFPDELKEISEDSLARSNERDKHIVFSLWAHASYNKEVGVEDKYSQYENNHTKILDDLKLVLNDLRRGGQYGYLTEKAPIYAVAVLMRDFRNKISSKEINYCEVLILDFLTTYLEENVFFKAVVESKLRFLHCHIY